MNTLLLTVLAAPGAAACTPTVQMAAPREPIEITLNVNIEHGNRANVDQELADLFAEDSEIF